jgi:hypothetical protein
MQEANEFSEIFPDSKPSSITSHLLLPTPNLNSFSPISSFQKASSAKYLLYSMESNLKIYLHDLKIHLVEPDWNSFYWTED